MALPHGAEQCPMGHCHGAAAPWCQFAIEPARLRGTPHLTLLLTAAMAVSGGRGTRHRALGEQGSVAMTRPCLRR